LALELVSPRRRTPDRSDERLLAADWFHSNSIETRSSHFR
jgi:hypothetical protein